MSLAVQPIILQLCHALPAGILVLLPVMGPLAVHAAAVFHETAGRAVLELDGAALAAFFFTVGARVFRALIDRDTAHAETTIRPASNSRPHAAADGHLPPPPDTSPNAPVCGSAQEGRQ